MHIKIFYTSKNKHISIMKAIGFKNFRKFQEFPLLGLAPITIFVGGNNSGKSTTVKAIISVLTYLRNARFEIFGNAGSILLNNFYFNENPYVHIGTFKRAKCNKIEDDSIYFFAEIEEYKFQIFLKGDDSDPNTTYARVSRLVLDDSKCNAVFDFDFSNDNLKFSFGTNVEYYLQDHSYLNIVKRIEELQKNVDAKDISAIRKQERLKKTLREDYPVVEEPFIIEKKITLVNNKRMVGGPLLSGLIYNTCYYFMDHADDEIHKETAEKIYHVQTYIFRLCHRLDQLLCMTPLVEYIYAHAASQIVLYNSTDNNYLSRTVHEFAELKEETDPKPFNFVREWMRKFGIGDNFKCESIGGEAHTFDIFDVDGKQTPLADKGMGTIQLMILLLRISLIVNRVDKGNRFRRNPTTVIVEEPEQNLHPNVQSLLIDFFASINKDYNIKFIIETHSEYLIRRSQVLVAQVKFDSQEELDEKNPFRVYYFPVDSVPYAMKYRPDGKFANKFQPGFFDEASRLSFDLF